MERGGRSDAVEGGNENENLGTCDDSFFLVAFEVSICP